jgi:OmpA family
VENFDTVKVKRYDFNIPEKLTLRINFPTDVYDEPYRFILDSNGVETSQTWMMQMDLLAANINISSSSLKKIILYGHTDEVGTKSYNFNLGKKRVEFVINELIKRGVSEDLLEGKSAGETKPLKKRKDENENLELYRKRLRRVELEKIWNN